MHVITKQFITLICENRNKKLKYEKKIVHASCIQIFVTSSKIYKLPNIKIHWFEVGSVY